MLIISGKLHPSDGVEGCTFEVRKEEDKYEVTIRSPFDDEEILVEDLMEPGAVFNYLENASDW